MINKKKEKKQNKLGQGEKVLRWSEFFFSPLEKWMRMSKLDALENVKMMLVYFSVVD